MQVSFVTDDIALFNLCSKTKPLVVGMGIAELHSDETTVAKKYQNQWYEFYEKIFLPKIKMRFISPLKTDRDIDQIIKNIKSEILLYEKAIY